MKARFALALLLGLSCSLVSVGEAQAQYGLNGCGGYGACGIYDIGRLYRVLANNVPYYAAFPPVYYSAPVPRTYGYSPFAYPPGVMTPEIVVDVAPEEIINPHVSDPAAISDEAEDKLTRVEIAPRPLVVMNPYAIDRVAAVSASNATERLGQ